MKKNIAKFALEFADMVEKGDKKIKLFDDCLIEKVNAATKESISSDIIRNLAKLGLNDFQIGSIIGHVQAMEKMFRQQAFENIDKFKEVASLLEKMKEEAYKSKTEEKKTVIRRELGMV